MHQALRPTQGKIGWEGYGLYRLRKNSVLYQGTALVVPQMIENTSGLRAAKKTPVF
jgi:hypothetical protein